MRQALERMRAAASASNPPGQRSKFSTKPQHSRRKSAAESIRSQLLSSNRCPMVFVMAGMYSMNDLLNLVAREGADELHLEPGRPPVMVVQGKQRVVDGMLVTSDDVAQLFRGIATEEQRHELDRCGTVHFAFAAPNSNRFNVRVAMQGQHLLMSIRNLGR